MYLSSPVGKIALLEDEAGICGLYFDNEPHIEADECESELLLEAALQLSEYFEGRRTQFELPLSISGTPFQKSVWQALQNIPYGETRSYGQIAAEIGNSKASRAVGMANNRNKIAIIIPCHRVIGANGALIGFGGGLDKKTILLELEKSCC